MSTVLRGAPVGLECVYCGATAEVWDHVIPRCLGGPESDENLVPACVKCNAAKSDLPAEVFQLTTRERSTWLKGRGWKRLGSNSWQSPEPSDRAFYSIKRALQHEGFERAGLTAVRPPVARRADTAATESDDPFVGLWFHSWTDAEKTTRRWQGCVKSRLPGDQHYFVQTYSWWDGEPMDALDIASVDEMLTWTFYESNEAMRISVGCRDSKENGEECGRPATIRVEGGLGTHYVCGRCAGFYGGTQTRVR